VEVFKEIKEGVERETPRHNGANMMAENVGEDKGHDVRKSVTEEASRRIALTVENLSRVNDIFKTRR